MSVHYKFKSALEYDTVTFDGLHISVRDLKKAIIHQKRIGKSTDFDLQVTNAQTKEVYTDDNALIAKNTSLIIARVPLTIQQKKAWDRSEANQLREGKGDGDGQDPAMNRMSKTLDLASLDASEEDKIKAMMSQSTQDYNPINYVKVRGSNQVGEVPANYRCYKCHQPGHWIKNCPLGSNQEPVEIKKSTGIPRSFLVSVEGPGERGAMMTPSGQFAVPAVDHQAYKEGKRERPPFQAEPEQVVVKPEIPEDLLCSVCMDLLTDAVMVPCCGVSFCDECIRTVLIESEEHECPDCQSKNTSPNTLIPNRYLRTAVNNFRNKTGYVKPRPKMTVIVEPLPPIPPVAIVAPPLEVLVAPLAIEEDEPLDPPGTQAMVEPLPEEMLAEGQPITQLQHRPRHGGHHPVPPGTRYVGPPGMSGRPLALPPHIQGHLAAYPLAGPRRHSMEDRPGTPTIDERLDALPDTSVPPPNCVPAAPYQPPVIPPQPIYPQDHRAYGPPAGPGYEPAHIPFHHDSNLGPSHYMGPDSDGRGGYRSGYRGRSRAPYPGPYRGGSAGGPPDRLPANGTQPGGPPAVIEDTLAVFERMLREKDERDRKRRARRSRSRSYTPRSRTRSRSYTRSRTRTPPPRKRERTRSRSFSISRSCSRSYSRSPGPRPPPRERERERTRERTRERDREREYSPQRRPERFRSPQRSPTRYHHPVPGGRGREFDYDEPEFTSFAGRQRGVGSDQRFAGADRKDKDYFNNHAGAAIRYPPEEPRYPRNSPPCDVHLRPNVPPGVRYDRYNNPIVSSSVRNYDGPRNFDGPRPFNGPRTFDGPPRHFDGPQRPYEVPPMNRPYDQPPTNRPYDDGPMNQRPYDDGPASYRQHDTMPDQRQFDGPPMNRPYESAPPNPRPFDRRFDAFDEAPPGTGPDLPIPGTGPNRYDRNFNREYELTPPGEERSAWDEMDSMERERAFFEMQTMGEEDSAAGRGSPRKISRERDDRRDDRRGGDREDRRGRDDKRGEKEEKRPADREDKRVVEKEERRGGNREEKRGGERDGKRGSDREQYGSEREERRVSGREEKRGYERTRRGSGKDEKRERDEKYGKERDDKRASDRDEKRSEKDDIRSSDKEDKQSRNSVKDVQKENLPEQKDVKSTEQDPTKENDHAADREKDRKKDEKKSKDRKKKKKEKGDEDKKKKKRKGKKDGTDKKLEKKEKEKPVSTEPVVPLETAEIKPEPPKEEPKEEPTQSLYEDMEDAPIDPDVIATYKEVNETEGKADLAPLPELSKWEMDDEFTSPSEKKQGEAGTPDSASKMVTSEVLKRAENAIFQKAINAIRPSDVPKKAEKERKPESEVVKPERKEAEPPKSLDRERKGETSSRDRKTYSDRDDQPRADRERKDRDRGKPERLDAKSAADESREARKAGNSIQITIPVEIPSLLEMSLEPPAKLKGKLDRSKFSTANWTQKDDAASPIRVSAKDRLGARVDDLGRRPARSKSPSRKPFKSSVESTVTVSGFNRSYSPPPKLFKSSVEVKYDQNSRSKDGAYRQRSPHRDRRIERGEPDHWKDDRRYERPSDRRRHDSRDARDRSEDSRVMDVRDERSSDRRRHESRDTRDRSDDSRPRDVSRDEKEEKIVEERKDKDEEKKDKKKDEKRTHKKGDSKNGRKRSTSDRDRKKKDKKHKKVKDRKKDRKDDDKKEKDPLQERELAANPERESEEAAAVQKDVGDDSAKKPRKADRKKSTLDEASFEPDYGISTEAETDDDAEKKPAAAVAEKEEVKTVSKKRSRSQDSESSSSSESSSESSDHHRKRHKRHKRKKSKKSTTEGSSSGSESNRSSSESEEKKRKTKNHHKRSKTKTPEHRPPLPIFNPRTRSWTTYHRNKRKRPYSRIYYPGRYRPYRLHFFPPTRRHYH